ncbi:MAG: response regulator [Bdellovibrionota bacterium]
MAQLKKILLVDDVPLFLELQRSFLKGVGAQVLTAASGQEAVDVAGREQPDLIIMDLIMPGMGGDEACRKLKGAAKTAKIPIILVTAQTAEQAEGVCKAAGCDAILYKPIRRADLLERINGLFSTQQKAPLSERRTVLIIGESRFYGQLLQDMLVAKGYDVLLTTNEIEVRKAFSDRTPHLVLLDLIVSNLDALKLYEEYSRRPECAKTRFVALTSLSQNDPVAAAARDLGIRNFISKSVPPADIGYRVDEILFAESADTRRSPRFTLRIPLEYKKGQFWIMGELVNVSETGMAVRALELPELGANILVRFAFPHQKDPCEEEATVVWVQSPDSRRVASAWTIESGFGLRFVSTSGQFQKQFEGYRRKQPESR